MSIDDPRTAGIKIRPYSVVVNATCDLIRQLGNDIVNKTVIIPLAGVNYVGSIEEVEYSISNNTISITGKI
jgi:hypothetical protein